MFKPESLPTPERSIRLRSLLHSRSRAWLLALLLGLVTLLAAATLLALSGWFISAAALAGLASVGAYGFDYFRPAAIIRLCAIGRTAGRYAERLTSHYAALGLLKDLRVHSFTALAQQPHSTRHSADTLQHLVGDIDLLDQFPLKVIAPWLWAVSLTSLVLLFWYLLAPSLLVAAAPCLLLALALPLLTVRRAKVLAQQDTDASTQRRTLLLEPLSMLISLLLWQRWPDNINRFSGQDKICLNLQLRQQLLISRTALLQQSLLALGLLSLLWQGSALVADNLLSVPLLLAAMLALWALHEALLPLCQSFIALGLSSAARDRLNRLTDVTAATALNKPEPAAPLCLNVNRLSARQSGALVGPSQLSFKMQSGEVLLISGASGSGKTTLLQTLAKQLAFSGEISLNGLPYSEWQLSNTVGYLPQQADLFDLTLAQNLRLAAPTATDAQLWQVLDDVALSNWAKSQPLQLDTLVSEYGAAVSGGQARRIALARLLLTQRPVLLLDEPFAGLDPATTAHLLNTLLARQRNGLLLIVSHQQLNVPGAKQLQLQL
jgi:ATP-binding cassette subfamily C protein CydC